jgi:uncharacterized protein with NAD-binding domain and iron-sulfur cluster
MMSRLSGSLRTAILLLLLLQDRSVVDGFSLSTSPGAFREAKTSSTGRKSAHSRLFQTPEASESGTEKKRVVVVGAGWGGLSAAYHLSLDPEYEVTVVDAASRVGGLVRDGFTSMKGKFPAEAGQHGFWDQYHNIFRLLRDDLGIMENALTGYAEQGQYSPDGLEAVWPIYRQSEPSLPTGLAQAAYTKFLKLPLFDRLTAFPLVLAFSEFDDSPEAWETYDKVSFRDLCLRLGVSKRCYDEAFEPMILTGLFAPGAECSAAAALGMAYFFVLSNQKAFDVRWCKGNIGDQIMDPWIERMKSGENPVKFQMSSRVTGFEVTNGETSTDSKISKVLCTVDGKEESALEADEVVFSVGAAALNAIARNSPELSQFSEFRNFANLRGTSVLATRLFLDRKIDTPYTANACWGFDRGVGMTFFNIGELHGENFSNDDAPGSVIEVDYYHANTLLVMSDEQIAAKAKKDLNTMLGVECAAARVIDAAIVRLPNAVNWYFPGSYADMPDVKSKSLANTYFAGDIVRSRHGSWSQEKAFVTGMEAANQIRGKQLDDGILPLTPDEPHVALARTAVKTFRKVVGGEKGKAPSLLDFLFR